MDNLHTLYIYTVYIQAYFYNNKASKAYNFSFEVSLRVLLSTLSPLFCDNLKIDYFLVDRIRQP